jgi:uncharacterized membrane protein YdjX (TVP38/TMEM64 family)/rhodanese-related sulfurtransferase
VSGNQRLVLRVGMVVLVAAGAVSAWILSGQDLNARAVETAIDRAGDLAPLIFIAAFAAATVLFLPGSLFGLAGGALFGPLWGTAANLAGATLGATIAFLLARFVGGRWISAQAEGRLKALVLGVEAEGWRFVALTRLVPLVPFNALNYALGLTRIPLSHYVAATLACMVPGAAAFAWLGHAGRRAIAGDSAAIHYGMLGLAAVGLVAFLPRLIRRLRERSAAVVSVQDLKRQLAESIHPVVVDVREPHEFSGPLGSIPGAINIPLGDAEDRCHELRSADPSPVVLVCRTDKRSEKAAKILRSCGVTNLAVLRGGMEAWAADRA